MGQYIEALCLDADFSRPDEKGGCLKHILWLTQVFAHALVLNLTDIVTAFEVRGEKLNAALFNATSI